MNFEVNKYYKHYDSKNNIDYIFKVLSLKLSDSGSNYIVFVKYINNNFSETTSTLIDDSYWANRCELILGNEEQCLKFVKNLRKIKNP